MILVALGANLPASSGGSPLLSCETAVNSLRNIAGLHVVAVSPWYRSRPIPPSGQPPYVNGVARLEGEIDPAHLLQTLHEIEAAQGRERTVRDAARTLDLDIVAIDALVRTTPDPILPHPRMHERAFVLRPLLDVAHDWRHPIIGLTARALLRRLPPQGVTVLRPSRPIPSHLRDGETPTN